MKREIKFGRIIISLLILVVALSAIFGFWKVGMWLISLMGGSPDTWILLQFAIGLLATIVALYALALIGYYVIYQFLVVTIMVTIYFGIVALLNWIFPKQE